MKVVHDNWENSLQMDTSEKHLGGRGWGSMGQKGKKSLKSDYWKTLQKMKNKGFY